VTEILLDVEDPVHALGRVHVNVKGGVPAEAVEVHVKGLPTVWPVPQLTEFVIGWPPTVTEVEADAVLLLALVAVTDIVRVPLGEHVTDIVPVVEDPLHPVGRVHAKV